MDNQTFQRIKDLINQHQSVGVVVAPNPSLDGMAAGLGMYLVLKQMGKNPSIACPTDAVVGVSSLVGIDKVQKTLSAGGNGDLTVAFPYKEGEIEKVAYTLDNGKLNIQVKAGPQGLNFQQSDVEFVRAGSAPTLIFTIGVPSLSVISSVVTPVAGTTNIVNIDNKDANEKFGDVQVVSSRFSSVSEQVADFVTLLEPQVELDVDTCQNLMTGIIFATNDFTTPNVSYLAFEMAGILMKKGAKRTMPVTSQPNVVENAQAFLPPTPVVVPQNVQPVPQPFVQPVQPMPVQMPQAMPQMQQSQPAMQEFVPPVAQSFGSAPLQTQNMQSQPVAVQQVAPAQAAPADWLTPKVYKGSTVV